MSPTPLIELQRRLAEAGRIRMGEKTEKGAPKRLSTWRITSPDRSLIEQAAGLYGGKPEPWESPTGPQFEVVTTSSELPVLVMPGYSFRQGYEFRTSPTLVERRCDGIEQEDGSPCLCNKDALEGDAACNLITRLTVALPELTTMLGWRLETKGENAARELLASMDLVRGVGGGRPFVPAKLRIVERRGNVNGQAVRYVVPVIDVQVRYAEILGGEERPALPAGYMPIEAARGNGVSLEQGLAEAERDSAVRNARSAAEIPVVDDDIPFGDGPVPVEDPGAPSDAHGAAHPAPPLPAEPQAAVKMITKAQATKLNVLVGKLRDDLGKVSTEQLYATLASDRNVEVDVMIELTPGARDDQGALHWGPLRDSMTRAEASNWIERLEAKEAELAGATA